jgi:hypothetical protein
MRSSRLTLVPIAVAIWLLAPAWSAMAGVPSPTEISPKSGPVGTDSVLLDGDPCQGTRGLVWFSTDLDGGPPYVTSTEMRGAGGQRSFVVPDLPPGKYALVAGCVLSGEFEDPTMAPSILFAEFTVMPDTAIGDAPVRDLPGAPLVLVVAALVGALSWLFRTRASGSES